MALIKKAIGKSSSNKNTNRILMKDIAFNSQSTATSYVTGHIANGSEWSEKKLTNTSSTRNNIKGAFLYHLYLASSLE